MYASSDIIPTQQVARHRKTRMIPLLQRNQRRKLTMQRTSPPARLTRRKAKANPRKPMKAIFRCRTTRNSPRYLRAEIPGRPSRVLQTSIRGASKIDGYTASVLPHDSNKTRFDLSILAGNVGGTYGPNFHFSDVNYYDLHLTGDNVPSSFTEGLNIHVIAEIKAMTPHPACSSSNLFPSR